MEEITSTVDLLALKQHWDSGSMRSVRTWSHSKTNRSKTLLTVLSKKGDNLVVVAFTAVTLLFYTG